MNKLEKNNWIKKKIVKHSKYKYQIGILTNIASIPTGR